MMKKLLAVCIALLALTSCQETIRGNGVTIEDKRIVEAFDEIDISGKFSVFLRQGEKASVVVEADENFLPHIFTKVSGDRLKISADANFKSYEKLAIYITARELEYINMSGAIELKTNGVIQSDDLKINASGACMADMELQCEDLEIDGSGAIELNLIGFARDAEYDVSGAGEINAIEMETRKTSIDMSGAGRADVYVTDELRIQVSGAGEVNYRGNPRELKQDISGAAEINQLNN